MDTLFYGGEVMAGFGSDAIAVVTDGLRRSTGSFAERMVSHGLIGDIVTAPTTPILSRARGFFVRFAQMWRA